jgi:RimJ/RimL family protein N-acetyltransferase
LDIQDDWRRECRIHLETSRLLLRPLVTEDVDWLAPIFADREVNKYLWECASTPTEARQTAKAVVSLDLMRSQFGHWAILDKNSGVVHGWTELSKLRPSLGPSDEIALSYVLRLESWGCGIATEAAGRLLRHAFEILELDVVMAVIMADNTASRRVLEKLGMRVIETPTSVWRKKLQYFRIDAPTGPAVVRPNCAF